MVDGSNFKIRYHNFKDIETLQAVRECLGVSQGVIPAEQVVQRLCWINLLASSSCQLIGIIE